MTKLPSNFHLSENKLTVDLRKADNEEIAQFMSTLLRVKAKLPDKKELYLIRAEDTLESWTEVQ